MQTTLKLLIIVGLLVSSRSLVYAQAAEYKLVPSEYSINTKVHKPDEGYGVNVRLYLDGKSVTNQAGISYKWAVTEGKDVISLASSVVTDCTHDINPPCPNNTADFRALKEGVSLVKVDAYEGSKLLASTVFDVWVSNPNEVQYTLVPSESGIVTHVNTSNTGYGINVKLLKDGELVKDQSKVSYKWSVADTSVISITPWAASSGCTFDIMSPCPNNTADLKGLKVGQSSVYVIAYVDGVKTAATTILVEVKDVWKLSLIKGEKKIGVGQTADFEVRLENRENSKYKPGSEITYLWQEITKPNAPYVVSMVTPVCSSDIGCSYNKHQITGLAAGKTLIQVIAMSDSVQLDKIEFEVEVVNNGEVIEEIEMPIVLEEELLEYYPIEDYIDPMNQSYDELKKDLDEQKKILEAQQKKLDEQNARILKTENLLQRLLRMVREIFN